MSYFEVKANTYSGLSNLTKRQFAKEENFLKLNAREDAYTLRILPPYDESGYWFAVTKNHNMLTGINPETSQQFNLSPICLDYLLDTNGKTPQEIALTDSIFYAAQKEKLIEQSDVEQWLEHGCFACELGAKLAPHYNKKNKDDQSAMNHLWQSFKGFFNVLVRVDGNDVIHNRIDMEQIKIWGCSQEKFLEIQSRDKIASKEGDVLVSPKNGYDVYMNVSGEKFGKRYKLTFASKPSPIRDGIKPHNLITKACLQAVRTNKEIKEACLSTESIVKMIRRYDVKL